MAWTQLKNAINNAIKANNNQEITGSVLNSVLNTIVNSIGKYATFAGIATPSANPGVFEGPVVYFANTAGTYPNFNNITVGANKIVALYNINGTWDSYEIGDNNITTSRIVDKAVTTEKLAPNAVTTPKLALGAVTGDKIAAGTITGDNIQDKSLSTDVLADDAVSTDIIQDGAVTTEKLADSAMSAAMTKAVNSEAEARGIAINNEAQARAKNDQQLSNAIIAETARAKAAEEANATAIIGTDRLAPNAVTTPKLALGAVTGDKIAAGTITGDNIQDKSLSTDVLADDAVSTDIIQDGAVTTEKLADSAMSRAMADAINANAQAIAKRGIYDVSAYNDGAVFESLSALLNHADLSTLIPTSVRCGGMSIRFIQGSESNSDNKYVQYRLMADDWSTTPANWQGVDDEPTVGSDNLVKSGGVKSQTTGLRLSTMEQGDFTGMNKGLINLQHQPEDEKDWNAYSNFIPVGKGDRIVVKSAIDTKYYVISFYSKDSFDTFVDGVIGATPHGINRYEYIAPQDGYVVVSCCAYYVKTALNERWLIAKKMPWITEVCGKDYANDWLKSLFWIESEKPKSISIYHDYIYFYLNDDSNTGVCGYTHFVDSFIYDKEQNVYIIKDLNDDNIVGFCQLGSTQYYDGALYSKINTGNIELTINPVLASIVSKYVALNNAVNYVYDHSSEQSSYWFGYLYTYIQKKRTYLIQNKADRVWVNLYDNNNTVVLGFELLAGEKNNFSVDIDCYKIEFTNTPSVANITISQIETINKPQYLTLDGNIELPFGYFERVTDIIDATQMSNDDWRKGFPGLNYSIFYNGNDNKYYLFYAAWGGSGTNMCIGVATSADLVNWVQNPNNPIIVPSIEENAPDKGGMTCPNVIQFGDKYIMYYCGFSLPGFESGVHTICYATSSDLINWTKGGAILECSDFPQYKGQDIGVIYVPRVKNIFGKYYMFINAGVGDAAPNGPSENIYVAVSDNPISGWSVLGLLLDSEKLYPTSEYKIIADPDLIYNGNHFIMVTHGTGGLMLWGCPMNEFPMNWKPIGKIKGASGIRPLFIPINDNIYLITNSDSKQKKVTLFRTNWA